MSPTKLKIPAARAAKNAPLTRRAIIDAALVVLDRDGYEALTMRSLATELGVQAASLYWHVKDKSELEDWLFGALLDEVDLKIKGLDWRDDLRAVARQMRRQLTRRRDMQKITAGRFVLGMPLLRHMEIILGVLRAAGLSDHDAACAIYALLNYVHGFILFQTAPLSAAQARGGKRKKIFAALRQTLSSLPPATYPNSVALAEALTSEDPDARFEFGLDLLVAGLERRSPPDRRRRETRTSAAIIRRGTMA